MLGSISIWWTGKCRHRIQEQRQRVLMAGSLANSWSPCFRGGMQAEFFIGAWTCSVFRHTFWRTPMYESKRIVSPAIYVPWHPPMNSFRSVCDPGPARVKTFIPKHLTCTTFHSTSSCYHIVISVSLTTYYSGEFTGHGTIDLRVCLWHRRSEFWTNAKWSWFLKKSSFSIIRAPHFPIRTIKGFNYALGVP